MVIPLPPPAGAPVSPVSTEMHTDLQTSSKKTRLPKHEAFFFLKETQEKVVPDDKRGHPSTLEELMWAKQGSLQQGGEVGAGTPGAGTL